MPGLVTYTVASCRVHEACVRVNCTTTGVSVAPGARSLSFEHSTAEPATEHVQPAPALTLPTAWSLNAMIIKPIVPVSVRFPALLTVPVTV